MRLRYCTLTGADEKTSLPKLAALSAEFPFVEWGFLYSPKRQGLPGRYPSVATLQYAFETLPASVNVALHVCGAGVPELLAGTDPVVTELVDMVERRGGRVQLNFNLQGQKVTLAQLSDFLERRPNLRVITQHNSANTDVWPALSHHDNLSVLFDSSGGKGVLSNTWNTPLHPDRCAYAGGLGPDNLAIQLPCIAQAAGAATISVDMEGNLRATDDIGDDWFDLDRARRSLEAVAAFSPQLATAIDESAVSAARRKMKT